MTDYGGGYQYVKAFCMDFEGHFRSVHPFGACVFCKSYDVKNNYHMEADSFKADENVNVCVGGDAYNFIINGTYFTGYMVLGGTLFLCGVVVAIFGEVREMICLASATKNNTYKHEEEPQRDTETWKMKPLGNLEEK